MRQLSIAKDEVLIHLYFHLWTHAWCYTFALNIVHGESDGYKGGY